MSTNNMVTATRFDKSGHFQILHCRIYKDREGDHVVFVMVTMRFWKRGIVDSTGNFPVFYFSFSFWNITDPLCSSQLPTDLRSLNGWTIVALVVPLTLQKKSDRWDFGQNRRGYIESSCQKILCYGFLTGLHGHKSVVKVLWAWLSLHMKCVIFYECFKLCLSGKCQHGYIVSENIVGYIVSEILSHKTNRLDKG